MARVPPLERITAMWQKNGVRNNAKRVEAAFRFSMMYHESKMVFDTHV